MLESYNYSEINLKNIFSLLDQMGYSDEAKAGFAANALLESNLQPNNLQNSYNSSKSLNMTDEEFTDACETGKFDFRNSSLGFGYGLCQWTSKGRRTGLWDYLKGQGLRIDDLSGQVRYFDYELANGYKKVKQYLSEKHTAYEMADYILLNYEKPDSVNKNKHTAAEIKVVEDRRGNLATEIYEKYFKMGAISMGPKFVINAGHGPETPGKRCLKALDPKETRENALNCRIVNYIYNDLKKYDCEILRLDNNGISDVPLEERKAAINNFKPDWSISIHHNALGKGYAFDGGGITMYFNSAYGLSMGEVKTCYNYVIDAGGLKGNRSTPIKDTDYYFETREFHCKHILAECGFMDSKTDTPIILTDAYARKVANGFVKFLVDKTGLKLKSATAEPEVKDIVHVTAEGDTLESVASKYGVNVLDLIGWNKNILDPGKPLIIKKKQEQVTHREYVVQPGETLSQIGARFGIDWHVLADLNGISDPKKLRSGAVIKLD